MQRPMILTILMLSVISVMQCTDSQSSPTRDTIKSQLLSCRHENHAQYDSIDEFADKLVDKLFDKVSSPSKADSEVQWSKNKDGWATAKFGPGSSSSKGDSIAVRNNPFAASIADVAGGQLPVGVDIATQTLISFVGLYNTACIVRLVLTWFPQAPPQVVQPIASITDPYLGIFRGIIPPLGGLDLSPILAFTALDIFQKSAAALPAQSVSQSRALPGKSLERKPFNIPFFRREESMATSPIGSTSSQALRKSGASLVDASATRSSKSSSSLYAKSSTDLHQLGLAIFFGLFVGTGLTLAMFLRPKNKEPVLIM